jgi:uncharacterized repeat protein (TIGR01451 family)
MNKFENYRRFIVRIIGILPLIISLGSSKVAFAASSTSELSVTNVADQSKVKVGQMVTYIATMTNLGPDDADFVDVRFSLPVQLTLVSMSCDFGISPDTPFCEYSSLPAGETVVSTLIATPNLEAFTGDRDLTVTADILLEQDCAFELINCTFDPELGNNMASVSTKLIGKMAHP